LNQGQLDSLEKIGDECVIARCGTETADQRSAMDEVVGGVDEKDQSRCCT